MADNKTIQYAGEIIKNNKNWANKLDKAVVDLWNHLNRQRGREIIESIISQIAKEIDKKNVKGLSVFGETICRAIGLKYKYYAVSGIDLIKSANNHISRNEDESNGDGKKEMQEIMGRY